LSATFVAGIVQH